jgi:hypothetical protein
MVALLVTTVLVAGAAVSSAKDDKNATWSETYRSDSAHHGPSTGRVKLMKVLNDKDFSNGDLTSILPLLQDLRDARRECDSKHNEAYSDMMLSRGSKADSGKAIAECD